MQEHDYVRQVAGNPLLAYVMLQVIDKFQHQAYVTPEVLKQLCGPSDSDNTERRTLTPQRFYRILYLIDKECQKRGLDLELPYYWYKSGPVVHAAGAPRVYKVIRLQKTQQVIASYAEWKDTILIFDGFESAYSDAILLTHNARQLGDLSKLDVVYEYSPSHTHKILITLLNELSHLQGNRLLEKRRKKTVQELLQRLILEKWDRKYDDIYPAFVKGTGVLHGLLEGEIDTAALKRAITALWNIFALALRSRENAHIDPKVVLEWENDYRDALNSFRLQSTQTYTR